jgi:hypothetical protein
MTPHTICPPPWGGRSPRPLAGPPMRPSHGPPPTSMSQMFSYLTLVTAAFLTLGLHRYRARRMRADRPIARLQRFEDTLVEKQRQTSPAGRTQDGRPS